jgi:hypothetical protein
VIAGFGWSIGFKPAAMSIVVASLVIATGSVALADAVTPGNGSNLPSALLPPPPGELQRELDEQKVEVPPPPPGPSAIHLDGASYVIDLPFTYEGGHIIIDVAVNGRERPFFLDSGATNILTQEAASELGIEAHGYQRLGGIGPQKTQASFATVDKVQIGRIALGAMPFRVTDLRNAVVDRGSRPRIAGLVGAELFNLFAVRIDYAKHVLRLTRRGMFHYDGQGIALPLTLAFTRDHDAPLAAATIPATIEGAAGEFIIDTGSGGQVLLQPGFMDRQGLRSNYPSPLRFLGPGGIGGPLEMAMVLGGEISIGTMKLTRPLVEFAVAPSDLSLRRHYAGLIGNSLMQNFVVTIDFASQHLYLEPTGRTQLARAIYGTGLFVDKPDHTEFEVIDVLHGSAAEAAGVRRGDRIVKIDGRPATDLGMSDFNARNSTPSHASIDVGIDDGRLLTLRISQILP